MMSLATKFSSSDTKDLDIIWGTLPGGAYDYNHLTLGSLSVNVQEFKSNVQGLMRVIKSKLDALSFDLTRHEELKLETLFDSPHEKSLGYSFLNDQRNQILENQGRLATWIMSRPNLDTKFLKNANDWNQLGLSTWLSNSEDLLKLFMAAIILTSGMPARSTELGTSLLANTLVESRHLFVAYNSLVLTINYNKSRSMTGKDNVIPRFLASEVAHLLLQYLVYIRPFEM